MTSLGYDIKSVTARARQRFPDHKVDLAYPVCLPVYELRLRVTVMSGHDLSATARFILQLSGLNVTQPKEIGRLLSLPDEYVRRAAAELLSADLIEQRPDLGLSITKQGRQALQQGGRTFRPGNRHITIPYDPLVKRIVDIDRGQLLDRDVVRKNGDYIVPTGPRKPQLSSVRLDQVRDYEKVYGRHRNSTEILDVSAIRDIKLRYRDDIILVKLDALHSNASIFAAYHARQYLEDVSNSLHRLATERGVDLLPDEFKADHFSVQINAALASGEESDLLASIQELDRAVAETDRAVTEAEGIRGTTQNAEERVALTNRVGELEADKIELKVKLERLEAQLRKLTNDKTRLIKTEDHRPLLFEAIKSARSELTIVSAWINPRTLDDELCGMIAQAIRRGVRVRIAWGLGTGRATYSRGSSAYRNQLKANEALSELRKRVPASFKNQLATKRTETHEKFVICDDIFCVWGSFNWLSYRGEVDDGYRRETSYYSERQNDIELWKNNSVSLFGS